MNRNIVYVLSLCCICLALSIQTSGKEPVAFGQVRVLYKTISPAKFMNKDTLLADTMELYVGGETTLYQAWNRKAKETKMKQMRLQASSSTGRTVVFYAEEQLKRFTPSNESPKIWNETWRTEQLFRTDSQVVYIDKMNGEGLMKVERSVAFPKWVISSDTLTILSYRCRKAETTFFGRRYAVWFAEDIPVPDGPWLLGGLPGLIMKAEDETHTFCFLAVGLESLKEPDPIQVPVANVKSVSYKDYLMYQLQNARISYYNKGIGKWSGYTCHYDAPNPLKRIPIEQ